MKSIIFSAVLIACTLILFVLACVSGWGSKFISFFFISSCGLVGVLFGSIYRYRHEKDGKNINLSRKEKLFVFALLLAMVAVSVLIKLLIHDYTIMVACVVPLWIATSLYLLYYILKRLPK